MHCEAHFFGSGIIGERGQIVIPASARDKLNIKPGDQFVFFSHGKILHIVKATELDHMLGHFAEIREGLKAENQKHNNDGEGK